MPFDVDVPGYKMTGEDSIEGDSLKKYPPRDGCVPWNAHFAGRQPSGDFYCRIIWLDKDNTLRGGSIKVLPK